MTLIELLVVIVILTTLVAGVIPILSPNNDTRKIREATRMLQTYIMRAQTEAARTGRPQGISFRESSAGSGVALDVFRVNVPAPFAGFSEDSRVELSLISSDDNRIFRYGGSRENVYDSRGNQGTKFSAKYEGAQLYGLRFVVAGQSPAQYDPFPPRTFRIGDLLDIGGNMFLIVDDRFKYDQPNRVDKRPSGWPEDEEFIEHLVPDLTGANISVHCVAVSGGQGVVLPVPEGEYVLKRYQFLRQPASSIEPPIQLPAGIAIDMQASVAEGGRTDGFLTDESLYTNPTPTYGSRTTPDTVAIMFSPTGNVSDVIFNGNSIGSVSRIALLLGRVENGGLTDPSDWTISNYASTDELEQLQEKVNWLNLDSRWLTIATSSGRAVTSSNAFVDARQGKYTPQDVGGLSDLDRDKKTAALQIGDAVAIARAMRSTGAGR